MKIMFSILGEGRGHMTQAVAAKQILERSGHQIVCTVLGMGANRQAPAFFASAMKMPITQITTLDFSVKNHRKVSLPSTIAGIIRNIPAYLASVRKLKAAVRKTRPDVLINFFEPLTGMYALTCRRRPPIVAVAHQFMCGHPSYVRAPGRYFQQLVMKWFVQLVGSASTRLALSLYEAPNLPEKDLEVCPPILRQELFELHSNPNGNFVLIYLLNHGYAEQVIEWHKKHPELALRCFYDKPGAPAEFEHDDTLTFYRLDGEKFLRLMAECKYVACTAGFESLSEAAYLGKPMFLVPVENHIEQEINAVDAMRLGLGVTEKSFNLDRLAQLPTRLENTNFRAWLARTDSVLLRTIERVVQGGQPERVRMLQLEPEEQKAV